MLTEFDLFCLRHTCADDCKDSRRYCPIADAVRAETGSYPRPEDCERFFRKLKNAE